MDEMRELLFEMTPGEDIILYLIQSALVEESLSIYTLILHLTSKMKGNFYYYFFFFSFFLLIFLYSNQ